MADSQQANRSGKPFNFNFNFNFNFKKGMDARRLPATGMKNDKNSGLGPRSFYNNSLCYTR